MGILKPTLFVLSFAVAYRFFFSKPFDPEMLRGKRVLLTGGSSGIGEEMAYQYASHGASVFITARREQLLQQVVEKCKKLGPAEGKYGYLAMDMLDLSRTEELVETAVAAMGGLDIVILNHAIMPQLQPVTANLSFLRTMNDSLTANVLASTHIAAHAISHLRLTHGCIGFVGSLFGKVPGRFNAPYCASKFALSSVAAIMRSELRQDNISVTYLAIGFTDTEKAFENFEDAVDRYSLWYGAYKNLGKAMAAKTSDVAAAIIEATSSRVKELVYPMKFAIPVLFRDFIFALDIDLL